MLNAILVNVIVLSAAFLFCFVMSSLFKLTAKMPRIVAPPQAHRWHCILLSALSLSYAVAYSECHYAQCHSGLCYYAECFCFVL
jgi:hypothetical protein